MNLKRIPYPFVEKDFYKNEGAKNGSEAGNAECAGGLINMGISGLTVS